MSRGNGVPSPDERPRETAAPGRAGAMALTAPWLNEDGYQALLESLPAMTYVRRLGSAPETLYVSPQVEATLGWPPEDDIVHPDRWLAHVHPDDRERMQDAVARTAATGESLDVEYRVVARGGQTIWLRDMAVLSDDLAGDGPVLHGILVDVTAAKATERHLHQLAFHDALTGLPNRRLCIDRLHTVLNQTDRSGIALFFLDLDRFKVINDGIGHAAGDELLVAVARRLEPHIAGRGSLARFGGDEFVVVLEQAADLHEVEAIAGALVADLRRPFTVRGYDLIVEGTIGIALAAPGVTTTEELLRAADVALYRAKREGGSTFAVFHPETDHQGLERLAQEAELRRALEAREFQIVYQPVVDIESRSILAVEALLRWHHPRRGVLRPAEFIPLADETGVIVPLGKWVVEEACRQVRLWQERYPAARTLGVSVNLSGRQFQAALAADVAHALRETGLSPASLALELKEVDALANAATIGATLKEFKQLGVKVTIDEFGKGWGALGALSQFTIDDLKIDGSFVSRLGQHQQDADIVAALVGMAKAVGLDVTASAVETAEQHALLRALGCDRAQGMHFSPPLPVEEMERLFASG